MGTTWSHLHNVPSQKSPNPNPSKYTAGKITSVVIVSLLAFYFSSGVNVHFVCKKCTQVTRVNNIYIYKTVLDDSTVCANFSLEKMKEK